MRDVARIAQVFGSEDPATTAEALATGEWNHLVAVVDRGAGEIRWYLNGIPSGSQTIPETMTSGIHGADSDIAIPSKHKPFRGLIGDLRIYRSAVTADRVRELYQEKRNTD